MGNGAIVSLVVLGLARGIVAGRTPAQGVGPVRLPDVNVVTDTAADRPVSEGELAVGDRLTVVGAPDGVTRVGADHGLELRWSP